MRPPRNPESGLTLIEVLIAVSLLSLLTLGMMWSIRIGLNSMGKANERLMANRRVTGAQRVLEQQIYNLIPVGAEVFTNPAAPSGQKMMFFEGQPQSMRFVSSYSLKEGSRGHAQILGFQVIAGDNGGVRLIVDETPYTGSRSAGRFISGRGFDSISGRAAVQFTPIEVGPNSFVLADKLASCAFSYQEIRPRPELQRWVDVWTANTWPDAIRIEMQPLNEVGHRLHMITVVAPVRVTRSPLRRPTKMFTKRRRGGALLAVMWLSAALAAIGFSIATTVKGETEHTSSAVDDVKSYYLATGAIERTILRMQWGGVWYPPGQPTIDYEFATGTVHVEIVPEASKMNINQTQPDQLFGLLSAITHDPERATEITQSIIDWRTPAGRAGSGALDGYYLNLNPSFLPRHASLEEIEELLAVRGMTPDIFYGTYTRDTSTTPPQLVPQGGLKDCVSVFGAVNAYDINGATPALMSVAGVPPDLIAAVLANRPFRTPAQYSAFSQGNPALSHFHFGGNTIFTIHASARLRLPDNRLNDLRRGVSAIIKLQPAKDPSYVVLRWYDRG